MTPLEKSLDIPARWICAQKTSKYLALDFPQEHARSTYLVNIDLDFPIYRILGYLQLLCWKSMSLFSMIKVKLELVQMETTTVLTMDSIAAIDMQV